MRVGFVCDERGAPDPRSPRSFMPVISIGGSGTHPEKARALGYFDSCAYPEFMAGH
jgi:hypothetical protein